MGLLIILGRTEKCRYEEAGGASEVRTSFMPPAVFIAVLMIDGWIDRYWGWDDEELRSSKRQLCWERPLSNPRS
uniref:Uncharacterized protein n=1 Tax=Oryza rufipogon TaxID=4529 RepID=A0A0E0PGM4_ORYRU